MDLEEYSMGFVYDRFTPTVNVYHSLALADEHRCALVQHHVQLVHLRQYICIGRVPDRPVRDLLKNRKRTSVCYRRAPA